MRDGNMYKRNLFYECLDHLYKKEITVIIGPRQVGKTTILNQIAEYFTKNDLPYHFVNLENPDHLRVLDEHPFNLFNLFSVEKDKKTYFLIDEIQYLKNPTNFLKLIYDEYAPQIKMIVSGSSAFYIDKKFKDSLAGRKRLFYLYSLSFDEILKFNDEEKLAKKFSELKFNNLSINNFPISEHRKIRMLLEKYAVYGGYPEVVVAKNDDEKKQCLIELVNSYVKKDIIESGVKNQKKAIELLKLLSFQIGNLLNINSLAKLLRLSSTAVENYLYVLRKSFHVATIPPFYTNIGKELRKMPKVFFLDLGLRNIVLNNFNSLANRQDTGRLYENLIYRQFLDKKEFYDIYFWKTQNQQNEVDFIINEKYAFEVKFNITNFKYSKYKKFMNLYPEINFNVIHHLGESENIGKIKFLKL